MKHCLRPGHTRALARSRSRLPVLSLAAALGSYAATPAWALAITSEVGVNTAVSSTPRAMSCGPVAGLSEPAGLGVLAPALLALIGFPRHRRDRRPNSVAA